MTQRERACVETFQKIDEIEKNRQQKHRRFFRAVPGRLQVGSTVTPGYEGI